MLTELLHSTLSSVSAQWGNSMPGVQVCQFTVGQNAHTLPFSIPVQLQPHHYEALFCQAGTLSLRRSNGEQMTSGGHDILLLSNCSTIASAQITSPLRGILITVDGSKSASSLYSLKEMLGNLNLHTNRIAQCMQERDGCALLGAAPWSQAVFAVLDTMPSEEQGMYCVLKTVELLYLLSTNSPLLEEKSASALPDSYLARTVMEMHAYMENHLDEKLTIDTMSRQFHISPTAFKSCFRSLYGQPVHHWLQGQRMKRAAELLRTTPMAILQIAQAVGYEGGSQFNVVFKRQFGMTPRQFKKMSDPIKF